MENWLRQSISSQFGDHVFAPNELSSEINSRLRFRPTEADELYDDRLIICTGPQGSGFASCPHGDSICAPCSEIARVDAQLSSFKLLSSQVAEVDATIDRKASFRANLVVEEVKLLLSDGAASKDWPIALVGFIGSLYECLGSNFGLGVRVTEMDTSLIGRKLSSENTIYSGTNTESIISAASVAVVTGMVVSTETLGNVLRAAQKHSTPIVFFAQTGANILRNLSYRVPVVVIQEHFPFYMWPGRSAYSIYRLNP